MVWRIIPCSVVLLQDVAFASTTHVTDCNSVSSIAVAGRQELALPAGASLKVLQKKIGWTYPHHPLLQKTVMYAYIYNIHPYTCSVYTHHISPYYDSHVHILCVYPYINVIYNYTIIRRPRPTARGSASGKRGCGQQEIQQRVGDQQQQQKPLQQQEEKVAKIHSSSKRKKQPKSSFSMRFR